MDPVRKITAAAQRIRADALEERISAWHWPRELAALAAEFDRMLQRLEDSFNRLKQFSADIAHELRTPVNNLMGETEVALTRQRAPEEYRRVLESSLEEYHRLAAMIDRMLFLSRADNASVHLERTQFAGRAAIDSVCSYYESLANEVGVRLVADGEGDLSADPGLFRRALSNVLANAIHHTPSGGAVRVSIRSDGKGHVVEVNDTGSGIAQQHLDKLFDRFYRADTARTSHPTGTGQPIGAGLGLAIVKAIMDLHEGRVAIESVLGKGTNVELRFP
jgi:two-component system heavy metal sensor histidine kinase CusS